VTADPTTMLRDVRAFEAMGVEELALVFAETDPAALTAAIEHFDAEVVKALGG
jgi:hypothetical protein